MSHLDQTSTPYSNISALAARVGRPVWIVDIEATTGDIADPQFGVVEIGWVLVRADGTHEQKSYLVDPGFPMNPYAEKITGISQAMYAGAPSLASHWDEIGPLFTTALISGFAVKDMDCRALLQTHKSTLLANGGNSNAAINLSVLDARTLWMIHSGSPKGQLGEVAAHFGHQEKNMHRALADARATATALDGLVGAMGVEKCAALAQMNWGPASIQEKEIQRAHELSQKLDAMLASVKGCGDFNEGLLALAGLHCRPHYSERGFLWWVNEEKAVLEGAPNTPSDLARHFGAPEPSWLMAPNSVKRCREMILSSGGGDSDQRIAILGLCRATGSASNARAGLIRDGLLPPWTGIDPEVCAFAKSLAGLPQEENHIYSALRAQAPSHLKVSGEMSSASASLAVEARAANPQQEINPSKLRPRRP